MPPNKSLRSQECRELSESAFKLVKHRLVDEEAERIREYIYENIEWCLGIEMLIDALTEDAIAISSGEKRALMVEMDAMEFDRGQAD